MSAQLAWLASKFAPTAIFVSLFFSWYENLDPNIPSIIPWTTFRFWAAFLLEHSKLRDTFGADFFGIYLASPDGKAGLDMFMALNRNGISADYCILGWFLLFSGVFIITTTSAKSFLGRLCCVLGWILCGYPGLTGKIRGIGWYLNSVGVFLLYMATRQQTLQTITDRPAAPQAPKPQRLTGPIEC